MWEIILAPLVACLVLTGMHAYLGIHVIQRKVIFVDLALAQIAALGTTVAFLFGIHPGSAGSYGFSLLFTTLGAGVFSLLRSRKEEIPQEAIIGLVYALAAAVSILLVDKAPHGAEHIKEIMTGSILWVKWETILLVTLIYLLVAVFQWVFRHRFLTITFRPEEAYQQSWKVRGWDFLFYLLFGIVITQSVAIAGVLLVFVFLVVPAIATTLLTSQLRWQILLGWALGALVSLLGLVLSYVWDMPSGPLIATLYGAILILIGVARFVAGQKSKQKALIRVAAGVVVVLGLMWVIQIAGHWVGKREAEVPPESESAHAQHLHSGEAEETHPLPAEPMHSEGQTVLARLQKARQRLETEPALALKELILILEQESSPFFRRQALQLLEQKAGTSFGYDPRRPPQENRPALQKMWDWWKSYSEGHRP